jgi:hypothetical protein
MQEHSSPNLTAASAQHIEEIDNVWVRKILANVIDEASTVVTGADCSQSDAALERSSFAQVQ